MVERQVGLPGSTISEFHPVESGSMLEAAAWSLAAATVTDAIVAIGEDGRILVVNPAAQRIFGYAADELIGRPVGMLLAGAEEALPPLHVGGPADPKGSEHPAADRRLVGRRRNGEEFAVSAAFGEGQVGGRPLLTLVLRDIMAELRLRESLQEAEAHLHGLAAERSARARAEVAERRMTFLAGWSKALTASLDVDTIVQTVARLAVPAIADWCVVHLAEEGEPARAVAMELAESAQQHPLEPVYRQAALDAELTRGVSRVLQTGVPELASLVPHSRSEGSGPGPEPHPVHGSGAHSYIIAPLVARGRVLGTLTVARSGSGQPYEEDDLGTVTDLAGRAALAIDNGELLHYLEAARAHLERQAAQLEDSNRLLAARAAETAIAVREREDVIAIVSHDLRTPLQTIAMATALLGDHRLSPERRAAHTAVVHRSVEQMEVLISDLVEATQISSGRLRLEPVPYDPRALVLEAVEHSAAMAAARPVHLVSQVPAELPRIRADPPRVLRIFSNLLANAIRFSPQGADIVIGATPQRRQVLFSVSDLGPGIDQDHLPFIFDRFWQAKRSGRGGAGLGLAIAKGIVETHGGRISAENRPGGGATFQFTLPRADSVRSPG